MANAAEMVRGRMKNSKKIIVVGGGASGLAAALAAAEKAGGQNVMVLERLDRIGKKILATGNGRCNLTNRNAQESAYHTKQPKILSEMLAQMTPEAVLDFFEKQGLLCTTEEDGRVYPYCGQASMVLDILRCALERMQITVECGCEVQRIEEKNGTFMLHCKNGTQFAAQRVILAAGGQAAPQFGTDGAGFALARMLGHHVEKTYPCLVPIKCEAFPAGLKGVRAPAALSLQIGGRCVKTERGEIQFAEYGVSGIPAMQLSCLLSQEGRDAAVSVDLFPNTSFSALRSMLEQRCTSGQFPTLETFLLGLVGKKLGHAVLKSCGIQPLSRQVKSLSRGELNALCTALKGWRFAVKGTLSWAQAQTTGGGVPLTEIDPNCCASRKCRGLYLTGELLDAAGDCGGFNLQWAWMTGIVAGRAAAK